MAHHTPHDEGALARETLAHTGAHVTAYHEPGTMDITRQQETFVAFMRLVVRSGIVIVAIILLTLLFFG